MEIGSSIFKSKGSNQTAFGLVQLLHEYRCKLPQFYNKNIITDHFSN